MNWQAISFDWNQVRAFLATVEEGSLSAAARALNSTQPTLSRQVNALEEELGVTLFERGPRATQLTEAGQLLLDHVRDMADAAGRISLAATGQAQNVSGVVSITATDSMAQLHLPPIIAKIRTIAPDIQLVVSESNSVADLIRREADIAIRHGRPEQSELIAKRVAASQARLYASSAYIDRLGRPLTKEKMADAQFFGFEFIEQMLPVYREMGLPIDRDNIKITTGSGPLLFELVRAGLGISVIVDADAKRFLELEPLGLDVEPIDVPVWIVTHRELHTSARIRLVYDAIAEGLSGYGK